MESTGFWYREGKIFDLGADKHIGLICKYPDIFNLKLDYIREIYNEFGEKIGFEGKAREVLIKQVSKDGWIRIRHYGRPRDYWSIQYDKYTLRKKDVKGIVEYLISENGIMDKYDEIDLLGYDDVTQFTYPFMKGGAEKFLKEHSNIEHCNVQLINDFTLFRTL